MLRSRLEEIQGRIAQAAHRSGREPEEVGLVAAVKSVPVETILEAVEAGVGVLGENYVQEAKKLKESIHPSVRWHMIGHLQSNKAREAVRLFDVIETVDRERIARDLQRHASLEGKVLEVLIQVNLSEEVSKSGIPAEEVLPLIRVVAGSPNLRCVGLMTLPPFFDDPQRARPYFAALRELRDRLQPRIHPDVNLRELSMGMSGDFEVAVEEGATWIRIGTALFGARRLEKDRPCRQP